MVRSRRQKSLRKPRKSRSSARTKRKTSRSRRSKRKTSRSRRSKRKTSRSRRSKRKSPIRKSRISISRSIMGMGGSCWDGYRAEGTKNSPSGRKTKSGKLKRVNNCVKIK
jgi:hypothetical protein